MRIGVNLSMIFTEVPLVERFALAKQAGFDIVEIQFPYELSIDTIKQQLEQHQLQLCLINVGADDLLAGGYGLACVPHRKAEYTQALDLTIQYATALNVPKINVLSGKIAPDYSHQQAFDCFIDNLKLTINQCQKASSSIQVVFEMINPDDMPNFLIQNLQDVDEVLQHIPEAKLQFDCYHIAKIHEPVLIRLEQYLHNIGHIQFADYPQRHEPDTGELDFTSIFNYLKHSSYQSDICAEYRPSQHSLQSFAWKNKI